MQAPVVTTEAEETPAITAKAVISLKDVPADVTERSKLRQQKFAGQTAEVSSTDKVDKLEKRAARFGVSSNKPAAAAKSGAAAVAAAPAPLTAEEQAALTKRRERFGKELTDTKETVESAKLKRAQRFGGALTEAGGDDKKRARSARFGL